MHILDALQMIPFALYFQKKTPRNVVTPTAQKGKKNNLNDVTISCVIAPRAGLPQGGFG